MAKKAINLDERERDLAVRVCEYVCDRMSARINSISSTDLDRLALGWTYDEIKQLCAKFLPEVA